MEKKRRRLVAVAGALVLILIITAVVVTVVLVTKSDDDDEGTNEDGNPSEPPPPSISDYGEYNTSAISCDAPCSYIGRDILEVKGGNVAEAAIGMLLCMGVMHSQSSGIGGGFLMIIYDAATNKSEVLNAREVAPLLATVDMYHGDSNLSQKGGLAVGVPGEIKGYWELYKKRKSGNVTWSELFDYTIKICEEGYKIDNHTFKALNSEREWILKEPSMAEIYVDPKTNDILQIGDTIKRPKLANTLRIIAQSAQGGDALYDPAVHELSTWFVEDLKEFGGIVTKEDMLNYAVNWSEPIIVDIDGGFTQHTIPPPGSGALSAFMLRVLSHFGFNETSLSTSEKAIKTLHIMTESFKHAYAQRTKLGDPVDPDVTQIVEDLLYNLTKSEEYVENILKLVKEDSTSDSVEYYGAEFYAPPNDHGTAHLSIIGPNGDAISVTSTVNLYFGAGIRSPRTGIIYNDQMDDFSAPNITNAFGVPPSPNNFIRPGKRPLSSMSPSIFTDQEGRVRLVVGTAGGTKITTTTTLVAIRNLWLGENIKEAIDARRIHHQLFPMKLEYEFGLIDPWVVGLEAIGHEMSRFTSAVGSSVCSGVARSANGTLSANWDFRRDGSIDGF